MFPETWVAGKLVTNLPDPVLLRGLRHAPGFLRSPVVKAFRRRLGPALALDPLEFADRRVLILGPARTLEADLADIDALSYDIIVKMNNALDVPVPALGAQALRCDVLFHSLTADTRPVSCAQLRRAGVRTLVHRTATKGAFLNTMIAAQRFSDCAQVRHVPCETYQALSAALCGACPTTGLVCAHFFLNAPLRELAMMGFTFFSTCYLPGYDDRVATDALSWRHACRSGHHDPRREARFLAQEVAQARAGGKSVTLGRNMSQAMQAMASES